MAIREISYPSYNQRDTIKAWVYTPIVKPRAVVQVVHGFGEHSRRYLHMILNMVDAGFVVCANDHVGHGKTAHDSDTWGDYGDKGYMTTTEDENTLRGLAAKEYPELPYIMFGHSWGSMIARSYAAHYGQGMAGLVICGTAAMMDAAPVLEAELKPLIDTGRGGEADSKYLGILFAGMVDRYENPLTSNDWISGDPNVVADHGADPFNNFNPPTIQSLYDFVHLLIMIYGKDWAAKVPVGLPIYNIAGDQDPVGNFGEGVYAVSNWLASTGHKRVTTKLYSGHRHEIHNDRDIRDEVVAGIIAFIEGVL